MSDLATLLAALCPHPAIHHPVLVLPVGGFQGLAGVLPWGA